MTARYERECRLPVPAEEAIAWHARPGAFLRLAPPWERIRIEEDPGGIAAGSRLVFRVRKACLWWRWVAQHRPLQSALGFVDEQSSGPFARWVHTHRFEPLGPLGTLMRDEVEYALPLGAFGRALGGRATERALARLFAFRHARTVGDLVRHGRCEQKAPLTVAVTGASGLVGSALCAFLSAGGHRVLRVGRSRSGDRSQVRWNPAAGTLETEKLESLDAVVHLAGENIGAGRWTASRKAEILRSREVGTRFLCERLAALRNPPRVLVSASAVGYYGDVPGREVAEGDPPGEGFLPSVCRAWEEATEPARAAGIRVVILRIGVVLSAGGGALASMLPAFRAGVGGPVGTGNQGVSWIWLDDLVGAIHFCLNADGLAGPVNATAPRPVTSAELARTLGRVLRRPAFVPLPAVACRLLLGEMGQALLLEGAKALPSRLLASGFEFLHGDLDSALRAELGLVAEGPTEPVRP